MLLPAGEGLDELLCRARVVDQLADGRGEVGSHDAERNAQGFKSWAGDSFSNDNVNPAQVHVDVERHMIFMCHEVANLTRCGPDPNVVV